MNAQEIFDRLTGLLNTQYGIDPDGLTAQTQLASLGIDSMHSLDVLMALEDELGTKFEDLNMPREATLGDVADLIARNLGANAAG